MATIYDPEFHGKRFVEVSQTMEKRGDVLLKLNEQQVLAAEDHRAKLNWLAFAIVGGALTFNPTAATSPFTILGALILMCNALLSYIAQCHQRNLNMAAYQGRIRDMNSFYVPYANAFDAFTRAPNEKTEQELIKAFEIFLDHTNALPLLEPQKTKWALKMYWYFGLLALGIASLGTGIILNSEADRLEVTGNVIID